jgi:hypothetical protein
MSDRHSASIGVDDGAGDEGRVVGGEVDDRVGDLSRVGGATEWENGGEGPDEVARLACTVPGVRVGPAAMALTRTPCGPYSAAQALVSSSRAAFEAP